MLYCVLLLLSSSRFTAWFPISVEATKEISALMVISSLSNVDYIIYQTLLKTYPFLSWKSLIVLTIRAILLSLQSPLK